MKVPINKPLALEVNVDNIHDIDQEVNPQTDANNSKNVKEKEKKLNNSMSKLTIESQQLMSSKSLFSSRVSSPRFLFNHVPSNKPKKKNMPFNSVKMNQVDFNQTLNENLDK